MCEKNHLFLFAGRTEGERKPQRKRTGGGSDNVDDGNDSDNNGIDVNWDDNYDNGNNSGSDKDHNWPVLN